ncbi:MAG: Tyrosine-tRNA ligase [Parcubacteria group bacterium GW2011_GWB1_42_9]|nr:MAG: Tyrosine-tRNA ligase [Parcubacteria group bacterium GW2011_GWB1_42_9]
MSKTKDEIIKVFLSRGIEQIYPSPAEFTSYLAQSQPLKIYYGIDPTGPTLHLGHLSVMLKLKILQDLGAEIIVLIGDFTAQIGDPTDKGEARQVLTHEQVLTNCRSYKKQIGKVLDRQKIKFVYNSRWLAKLNFSQLITIASEFTLGQMVERDMFQERIKADRPVFLHEFFYPLMQGYDSVHLGVNAEIGGNDQTFNMLTGRTMQKKRGQEKFVIATKLLVDPTGKKMGKSEGNMVTLADEPNDVYGKVMSWPDEMIMLGFEICTEVDLTEMAKLNKQNPRDAKMVLAREIVKIIHGVNKAVRAEKYFINTFQKRLVPDEVIEIPAQIGELLSEVLVRAGILSSKGEFKRLVDGGGVSFEGGENVADLYQKIIKTTVFKIGKKKFVKVLVPEN